MSTTQAGIFSTLRPFGLPPAPILSLILTYGLNFVATPRQYYGPLLGKNNDDPASLLSRAEHEKGVVPPEKLVKITRAKGAAANLAENMPLYVVASLVSWLAGVKPEYQNAYHSVWFLCRVAYKWAYLQGNGTLRSIFFFSASVSTFVMLIHGGNLLATKY
ncbi:hypothetical protein E1B28_000531 [Marasmius oreades]|uniref:Uncharacterized protein n=1 Tax=Marasmius oreades TaxID=181124 RepID=A0A9P8AEK5_9AGAR|nr:uncharacterized protein E1B28_000531 [Marasmius oreades]KAG7098608.1 hypothetical protein E1B28_000531 [Marasmius oreades]